MPARPVRPNDCRGHDPGRGCAGSSHAGAMCSARLACSRRTSRRDSRSGRRGGPQAAHPCRRARPSGGSQVAARVGARSADHLVHVSECRHARAGDRRRDRYAVAFGGVLSEARAIRSGPPADRAFDPGGAGDRRQSWRRLLAFDAVCDDARLLRHEHDVRGGSRRGHNQWRLVPGRGRHRRQPRTRQAGRRRRRAGRRRQSDSGWSAGRVGGVEAREARGRNRLSEPGTCRTRNL